MKNMTARRVSLKYVIYSVKYASATCIALIVVKIVIKWRLCELHPIWPPCNSCYKLQLCHLDKSTWIYYFQKHNRYRTHRNLYYFSVSSFTNDTSKSEKANSAPETVKWRLVFEKTKKFFFPDREVISLVRPVSRSLENWNRTQPEEAPCRKGGGFF